ncbi:MAG: hypothetical protein HUU06_11100 [Planctomycetaceae bacterium]|nr:hypothetical protein [Planctomycetota bacterium]NUN53315.1 hypothetical protein [Planctomycetaceae bacterium]
MSIANWAENKILDALFNNVSLAVAQPYVSLHTADPGETGVNEVGGGSYARQAASFGAAASGQVQNDANIDFTGMPAVTVVGFGIWDALSGGNCLWTGWLSTVVRAFVADDLAGDTIRSPGHGFVNDDRVAFEAEDVGTLPTGLSAGTLYWVVNAATDTFKVSTSQGGSAVDITAVGSGKVRKVVAKTMNAGDTFRFATGNLTLPLF